MSSLRNVLSLASLSVGFGVAVGVVVLDPPCKARVGSMEFKIELFRTCISWCLRRTSRPQPYLFPIRLPSDRRSCAAGGMCCDRRLPFAAAGSAIFGHRAGNPAHCRHARPPWLALLLRFEIPDL